MYSRDLNIGTLGANEIIIAASDIESEMCCWDLLSGAVRFRLRPCASSPHAIACVGGCFFAASQVRKAASSSVFYWPWNKSQAETRSFVEPIKPLSSNDDGTYIIGGGFSGAIYLWEKQDSLAKVKSELGKLKSDHSRSLQALKRWKNVYEDLHSFCVNELIDSCKETDNEEITTERTVLKK